MQRAYIYMEHPESGQVVNHGRLTLKGKPIGRLRFAVTPPPSSRVPT